LAEGGLAHATFWGPVVTSQKFTGRLRSGAMWAWSIGLSLVVFDFVALPIFEWRASGSYLFFGLATLLTAWAEKREFSTRVFLYRLHDAVIFSPWKYLLLYFLWISVFSPFTEAPLASLVYAANGWMSLFGVAVSAQFIFCERPAQGAFLLPARLALAFRVYSASVSLLMGNALLHMFFPTSSLPILVNQQVNLFLFFTMGLPFLLWDFIKEGRRLLPRWASLATVCVGASTVLLIGRTVYHVAFALVLLVVVGLFLYKKIRPQRALFLASLAAGMVACAAVLLTLAFDYQETTSKTLSLARLAMESRMVHDLPAAWNAMAETRYIGTGVGVTNLQGVWARVLAEAGVVGAALYLAFFLALLWDLYRVRHSPRVVVSNVALLSVGIFLLLLSHYVENPYGAYVWIWYAIWGVFASTPKKRRLG
jgi:hypothetical protein